MPNLSQDQLQDFTDNQTKKIGTDETKIKGLKVGKRKISGQLDLSACFFVKYMMRLEEKTIISRYIVILEL